VGSNGSLDVSVAMNSNDIVLVSLKKSASQ